MSLFKKTVAQREQVKLMLGLSGVSGSGKTYSALHLAYGITKDWSKIALADTENKSALYYAGDKTGPWQHIEFPSTINIQGRQGYHPDNWVSLIEEIEKDSNIEVLILDSISHEWQGRGGCLELVDALGKGFSSWKGITPRHNRFIDKMRESRLHIIATMRSASDYAVELNEKGKAAPRKIGLKSNQREGTDYEFGIIFDIEINHHAHCSKDRTGIYMERGAFMISPETGNELLAWATSGTPTGVHAEALYIASPIQRSALATICKDQHDIDNTYPEGLEFMKLCSAKAVQDKVLIKDLPKLINSLKALQVTVKSGEVGGATVP